MFQKSRRLSKIFEIKRILVPKFSEKSRPYSSRILVVFQKSRRMPPFFLTPFCFWLQNRFLTPFWTQNSLKNAAVGPNFYSKMIDFGCIRTLNTEWTRTPSSGFFAATVICVYFGKIDKIWVYFRKSTKIENRTNGWNSALKFWSEIELKSQLDERAGTLCRWKVSVGQSCFSE